jgi:hypothetical protein
MRDAILGFLTAALLTASSFGEESPIRAHPYVGYEFSVLRKTSTDHRKTSIEVFLTGDDYVGFRHREEVFGSITPVVRTLTFSNEGRRKATPEEQAALAHQLVRAGVFELAAEPWNEKASFSSRLDVRLNRRVARYSFHTRPDSGKRKAVHDIMLRFAKKMGVNRPAADEHPITTSEGDFQPTRAVKLAEVIADPAKFHGKRVSVVGYYHGEFEGSSLSVNPQASRRSDFKSSIWRGDVSTFAAASTIRDKNDSWMRVEGVFVRGPGGHMGLWPGEIVRLTRIEPLRSADP